MNILTTNVPSEKCTCMPVHNSKTVGTKKDLARAGKKLKNLIILYQKNLLTTDNWRLRPSSGFKL